MKLTLLFLVLFMSIAANLPDSVISRLGLEPNYLLAALTAIIIAWFTVHLEALLALLVVGLSIGANLPESLADSMNVNRDYLFATLVAIVIIPWVSRQLR